MSTSRTATIQRETSETRVTINIDLDGIGQSRISTGLGFYDHMLTALATHSRINITLECKGDLHVDDHHTVEDCALALGDAISQALGERRGIQRFASAYAPLDESLARVVLDLSGRPGAWVDLGFTRETIGTVATENLSHFFASFAIGARCTLHADLIRGTNNHHKAEAVFKALALTLRAAIRVGSDSIPSTKGVL
ncbi:MAG: imidazoleglycerol phosphate dehydratase HisB [Phycisphaerales bacterium]|jgi:imidazoleglycerol phosphate dehydratase HisB